MDEEGVGQRLPSGLMLVLVEMHKIVNTIELDVCVWLGKGEMIKEKVKEEWKRRQWNDISQLTTFGLVNTISKHVSAILF